MADIWIEEELIAGRKALDETIKSAVKNSKLDIKEARKQVNAVARGVLRIDQPRWREIDPRELGLLMSGGASAFYLVRLGFQFDIGAGTRRRRTRFTYARCAAYLWSAAACKRQPRVYEVIPKDLYEGEPRRVSIKVGPQIKIGEVEGSIGEVSTDLMLGRVEPVVVGWPGEDERAPYWDLRPKSRALLGVRHLWLIVESPLECGGFRLSAMGEGDVETKLGLIPIGPTNREWATRPSVLIA